MDKRLFALVSCAVVVFALVGCGESRYLPSAPGGGGGPGGVGGPRLVCVLDSTGKVHINKMSPVSEVIETGVIVGSTSDVLSLMIPVKYLAGWKAQVFTATLEGNGQIYEFKRPGATCAVVQDTLNNATFSTIEVRYVGELTNIPPGTYVIKLNHAFMHPCFTPPADLDEGWQYVDSYPGALTICRVTE